MSSDSSPILTFKKDLIFVLYVRVHIPASKHTEFFDLFTPAKDKVLADPECRFFFVQKQNPMSSNYDPDVISWVEGWTKGIDWLMEVQMKKDYYEPYRTESAKLFSKPMEFEFWTPEDGMYQLKAPTAS